MNFILAVTYLFFMFCSSLLIAKEPYHTKNVAIYEPKSVAEKLVVLKSVSKDFDEVAQKGEQKVEVQPVVVDPKKRELIAAFTADSAFIARIIAEGESNAQEREQFSGIFAKQLQWFCQIVETSKSDTDATYQAALAKKTLLRSLVAHLEQADQLLQVRVMAEKSPDATFKKARLFVLYDLNSRMHQKQEAVLSRKELEALVDRALKTNAEKDGVEAALAEKKGTEKKQDASDDVQSKEKQVQEPEKKQSSAEIVSAEAVVKKLVLAQTAADKELLVDVSKKVQKNSEQIESLLLIKEKMNEDRAQLIAKLGAMKKETEAAREQERVQYDQKLQELKQVVEGLSKKNNELDEKLQQLKAAPPVQVVQTVAPVAPVVQAQAVVKEQKPEGVQPSVHETEEKNKQALEALLLGS